MKTNTTTGLVIAAFLAAMALSPLALAQSGGGTVTNKAPTVTSGLTGSVSSTNNLNSVSESFTFSVTDENGEGDLAAVKIVSTDATFGTKECLAPFTSCVGWTKTDSTVGDGILSFSFSYTWPAGQAPGTYTQTVSVRDEGSYVVGATTDSTTFSNAASITKGSGTFASDGTADGAAWGGWSASPGATLVKSVNYLKASNTGTASGSVTVSYSDTAFASATTGGSVPIDGNIKFLHGKGSSPASSTFTATATDADGSFTFSIAPGETLWIAYELQSLPAVLADSSDYAAAYTFG